MFENIFTRVTWLDWMGLILILALVLSVYRERKKRENYKVVLQKLKAETQKSFEVISSEIGELQKKVTTVLERQKHLAAKNQNDIQSIKMSVNNNETNLEIIKNRHDVDKIPLRSEVKWVHGEPVDRIERAIAAIPFN